jgi:hypothetical protein
LLFFAPSSALADAACRDLPEEEKRLFFSKNTTKAVKICEQCTVREACLIEALSFGAQGVWGGTTYTERKLLFDDIT